MRPIAQRAGLSMIQLACQWNLAHGPVRCVAPTLIQEVGPEAKSVEDKRAELAVLPAEPRLTRGDVDTIRALGDNTGCMALKGASPQHTGEEQPDRWTLDGTWSPWQSAGGSTLSAASRPRGPHEPGGGAAAARRCPRAEPADHRGL